jgi:threonine 3-dehydrogenase
VVTHHFPAEDYEAAFDVMRSGDCAKVILDWSE